MQIKLIQKLTQSELDQITNLHFEVLQESFINNFGKTFLKIAYNAIVTNPRNIVLVLKQNHTISGFLVATEDDAQFNKRIIFNNFFSLVLEILKSILVHPLSILTLIPWFISSAGLRTDSPELNFIAIDPTLQRKGWGTKLLYKLNLEFKKRNIYQYRVGTKANNHQSNNFYKNKKFSFSTSKVFFGDKFNFYTSPIWGKPEIKHMDSDTVKPKTGSYLLFITKNFQQKFLFFIFIFFLILFIFKSFQIMATIPFYDFDEAHRAENAKRMLEYHSFLVPLTGSSQDRVENLKIPLKGNPFVHLYYHLERPFLVYLSMVLSISIFGQSELAYRLPSFLFGILIIVSFILLSKIISKKTNFVALSVGFLSLVTSSDLWLSSQYAQMDTGITLFTSISLLTLIIYCQNKKRLYLKISGVTFALGLLSKGQPIIILLIPLSFLILTKKLKFYELLIFAGFSLILLVPWLGYLIYQFGIKDVARILPGFAITSASIIDIHQKAPFFWYVRWWWESLRPGWTLFLSLFLNDLIHKNLDWRKKTLALYILGGLLAFSLPVNKIWWYVLPLIPATASYIYLSLTDYVAHKSSRILNIILIVFLSSIPILLSSSNTFSLMYGFIITVFVFILLNLDFTKKFNGSLFSFSKLILGLTVCFSLFFFYLRFPHIIPYHWNTKTVATYYKNLPGAKCLWVYDMPEEAALFYSNAGEINVYNHQTILYGHCHHYLMSASPLEEIYNLPNTTNEQLLFQEGNMKLFKLDSF